MLGGHDGGELLSPERLQALMPDIATRDVYVCGPPAMVEATRATPRPLRRLAPPHRHRAVRVLKALAALVVTVAVVVLLARFETEPPRTLNPNSALGPVRTPRALAQAGRDPAAAPLGRGRAQLPRPRDDDAVLGDPGPRVLHRPPPDRHRDRAAERRRPAHGGAQRPRRADPARVGAGGRRAPTSTSCPARPRRARSGSTPCRARSTRPAAVVERTEHVMGMPVTAHVRDPASPAPRSTPPSRGCARSTRCSAPTGPTARSRRLDARRRSRSRDADPLVREVLGRCEALRRETGGVLRRPRAAGRSTRPGSSRAGRSSARRRSSTPARCASTAGGDLVLARRAVARRDPPPARARPAVRGARARRAAPSPPPPTYERGEHILDPHTGRPPRGVLSVTVTGPDLATRRRLRHRRVRDGRATARRGPPGLRGYEAMTCSTAAACSARRALPGAAPGRVACDRMRVVKETRRYWLPLAAAVLCLFAASWARRRSSPTC